MGDELGGIRSQLADIERSLGRVEARQLSHHETMAAHLIANEQKHNKTDDRLRRVEHRQYWFSGTASALGMLIGAVVSKLTGHS